MGATVMVGDCIEVMGRFPDNFFDSMVTDPPYGLSFMGKSWDNVEYGFHKTWADEAFRVLKPGGHLVSFGGTRTYHRMASAVEDAGFEIRDMVQWLYGQGFPKSMNVGKAIDKAAGKEREVVGISSVTGSRKSAFAEERNDSPSGVYGDGTVNYKTAPATPEAEQWEGWGTALKPAQEPIVMARKPLIGTVAKNILEHGTGAINIDATRIGYESEADKDQTRVPIPIQHNDARGVYMSGTGVGRTGEVFEPSDQGRWPANVILTHHEDCEELGLKRVKPSNGSGRASGKSGGFSKGMFGGHGEADEIGGTHIDDDGKETVEVWDCHEDCPIGILDEQSDNASRFFYTAKASKKERNTGLPEGEKSNHPTVKPIALMRYLCRLITPPGGRILDPFCGSGTTGIAAVLEGFNFVGVEKEQDYVDIAKARIKHWKENGE